MVKVYKNGLDFINENKQFLDTNVNLSFFFYIDAPLLNETNNINYCLKVENDDKKLLALKLEPYNMILFGDGSCIGEFCDFIIDNNYEVKDIFGEKSLVDNCANYLIEKGIEYQESIIMDFMHCDKVTIPSDEEVTIASIDDLDTIYEYCCNFVKDCGLNDKVFKENIVLQLSSFRIIKSNGEIAAMAKISTQFDKYGRISEVYTANKFRNMGFAKKVVNACKNEIIEKNLIATLNVDRLNPISNHIYEKIGFEKSFSQSIFLKINKN